jgi:ATP-binding cassette, subfamily A (ABC1), member 3
LQTFIRLKVKGKPSVGRLFEFFEKSKERLSIQQYTIKQASVEQIFNKFAEAAEEAEFS